MKRGTDEFKVSLVKDQLTIIGCSHYPHLTECCETRLNLEFNVLVQTTLNTSEDIMRTETNGEEEMDIAGIEESGPLGTTAAMAVGPSDGTVVWKQCRLVIDGGATFTSANPKWIRQEWPNAIIRKQQKPVRARGIHGTVADISEYAAVAVRLQGEELGMVAALLIPGLPVDILIGNNSAKRYQVITTNQEHPTVSFISPASGERVTVEAHYQALVRKRKPTDQILVTDHRQIQRDGTTPVETLTTDLHPEVKHMAELGPNTATTPEQLVRDKDVEEANSKLSLNVAFLASTLNSLKTLQTMRRKRIVKR